MVKVTDGEYSDSQSVIVNVKNVQEPPFIRRVCGTNSEVETCATVPENAAVGTKIGLPINVVDQDEADYSASSVVPDAVCANAMSVKSMNILQSAPMPSNRPVSLSNVNIEEERENSQGINFQVARGDSSKPITISAELLLNPAGESNEGDLMNDARRDSIWSSKETSSRSAARKTDNGGVEDGSVGKNFT